MRVQSLGQEDHLEEEMTTRSSGLCQAQASHRIWLELTGYGYAYLCTLHMYPSVSATYNSLDMEAT